jgi:hypothetical protein
VQWLRTSKSGANSVGFWTLYGTEPALATTVTPGRLELAYPRGNASSIFSFLVAANPLGRGTRTIAGVDDLEGLTVAVSGTVDPVPAVSFCGLQGGACSPIQYVSSTLFVFSFVVFLLALVCFVVTCSTCFPIRKFGWTGVG